MTQPSLGIGEKSGAVPAAVILFLIDDWPLSRQQSGWEGYQLMGKPEDLPALMKHMLSGEKQRL